MALVKCPDCGREVSSSAVACPQCGCPVRKNTSDKTKVKLPITRNTYFDTPEIGLSDLDSNIIVTGRQGEIVEVDITQPTEVMLVYKPLLAKHQILRKVGTITIEPHKKHLLSLAPGWLTPKLVCNQIEHFTD